MLVCSRSQVHYTPRGITAFASDLGIRAGDEWPMFIAIMDEAGHGFMCELVHVENRDGDTVLVRYLDRTGALPELVVFND